MCVYECLRLYTITPKKCTLPTLLRIQSNQEHLQVCNADTAPHSKLQEGSYA
jgi:hypothetical protein